MMTGGQHIDYEQLAQDALRGIVRQVLSRVAEAGLPGQHHFYVSFSTRAPGVALSPRIRERYPEEMTIVLQHRFWDLLVNEQRFEVKLTFDGIAEHLVVPFAAIKVFFDPSVPYGLQFEGSDLAAEPARDVDGGADRKAPVPEAEPLPKGGPPAQLPATARAEKKNRTRKPRAGKDAPAPVKSGPASHTEPPQPAADNDTKIVHLDRFRKK
jgi:uncharacterized protein